MPPGAITYTNDESNDLSFAEGAKGRTPKKEFKTLRPYAKSPFTNIHLFFIYHQDDEAEKEKLKNYVINGHSFYKGLLDYADIPFHTDETVLIKFTDRKNPLSEIKQLQERRKLHH